MNTIVKYLTCTCSEDVYEDDITDGTTDGCVQCVNCKREYKKEALHI